MARMRFVEKDEIPSPQFLWQRVLKGHELSPAEATDFEIWIAERFAKAGLTGNYQLKEAGMLPGSSAQKGMRLMTVDKQSLRFSYQPTGNHTRRKILVHLPADMVQRVYDLLKEQIEQETKVGSKWVTDSIELTSVAVLDMAESALSSVGEVPTDVVAPLPKEHVPQSKLYEFGHSPNLILLECSARVPDNLKDLIAEALKPLLLEYPNEEAFVVLHHNGAEIASPPTQVDGLS